MDSLKLLLIMFLSVMATMVIVFTLFVAIPKLHEDEVCKSLFTPETSSETYANYNHCIMYPKSYNITDWWSE